MVVPVCIVAGMRESLGITNPVYLSVTNVPIPMMALATSHPAI